MEAICSSETSVDSQRTGRRHIPKDGTLLNDRCENLKPYSFPLVRGVEWDSPELRTMMMMTDECGAVGGMTIGTEHWDNLP
jgi:hypothetical protein